MSTFFDFSRLNNVRPEVPKFEFKPLAMIPVQPPRCKPFEFSLYVGSNTMQDFGARASTSHNFEDKRDFEGRQNSVTQPFSASLIVIPKFSSTYDPKPNLEKFQRRHLEQIFQGSDLYVAAPCTIVLRTDMERQFHNNRVLDTRLLPKSSEQLLTDWRFDSRSAKMPSSRLAFEGMIVRHAATPILSSTSSWSHRPLLEDISRTQASSNSDKSVFELKWNIAKGADPKSTLSGPMTLEAFLKQQKYSSYKRASEFFWDQRQMMTLSMQLPAPVYGPKTVQIHNLLPIPISMSVSGRIDPYRATSHAGPMIAGINGIGNDLQEAVGNYQFLANLAGSAAKTAWVFNKSNNVFVDCFEAAINFSGYSPNNEEALKKLFWRFHIDNYFDPKMKMLFFAHSAGNIHTFNAIKDLPKEVRERLIIVQIAPAELMRKNVCYDVIPLVNKLDPVPFLRLVLYDIFRAAGEGHGKGFGETAVKLINTPRLPSHPDSKNIGHSMQDPVYLESMNAIIQKYLEAGGRF